MKIVNRKTRKAIRKSVGKVIKKHGPEMAAGLAGGIASTLATLAGTEAPGTKGRKSNLAALSKKVSKKVSDTSKRVSDTLVGEDDKKLRKHGGSDKKFAKKKETREQELA